MIFLCLKREKLKGIYNKKITDFVGGDFLTHSVCIFNCFNFQNKMVEKSAEIIC